MSEQTSALSATADDGPADGVTRTLRLFAWAMLFVLVAFLVNNVISFWFDGPGSAEAFAGDGVGVVQAALYAVAIALAFVRVSRTSEVSLRADSQRITRANTFIIRACFWAVLFVGVADAIISFLRVEDLLPLIVGEQMTSALGLSQLRGTFIHGPLIVLGIIMAAMTRTLGFTWLALLVVLAELMIVIGRFIFSYEQAFMADLVRFWYAALFLFASAYTLVEEGHVRVDVAYAGFNEKMKGVVNAVGSLLLGIVLCWTILILGMSSKAAVINSPLLSFEVTQAGFGMYVKYLMAGFLGVFAVTMLIQFTAYLLESVADYRGEPGKRVLSSEITH